MAETKTKVNRASVPKFLKAIPDAQVRKDCTVIAAMMEKATKAKPEMWGTSNVGFGRRTQVYANGKTTEWMKLGFSPRKQNIALYGLKAITVTHAGVQEKEGENDMLKTLGKYKEGGGCVYIKRLSDVHEKQLQKIIALAAKRK